MKFNFSAKSTEHLLIALVNGKDKFTIKDPLSDQIKVNKKIVDICLILDDDGFTYLTWKGKRYQAEIVEKNQNKYTILVNGVSYNISVETPISFKRKKYLEKHKVQSAVEPITAPMPGKIVELLVEENMEIKEGDPIVILEAMKMQNEILSHVSGLVKKIHIRIDSIVNKDDILVEIER